MKIKKSYYVQLKNQEISEITSDIKKMILKIQKELRN